MSAWLASLLPPQLVRVIGDEKPEAAARLFNAPEGVRCPDLIWTTAHRRACFARAHRVIGAAVTRIRARPGDWPTEEEEEEGEGREGNVAPGQQEQQQQQVDEEDPYPDLSALPQVHGIYLEEFLRTPTTATAAAEAAAAAQGTRSDAAPAATAAAFIRPVASQDLLCQLLSPLSRLVKAHRASSSSSAAAAPLSPQRCVAIIATSPPLCPSVGAKRMAYACKLCAALH